MSYPEVVEQLAAAAIAAGRPVRDIMLIAVSKSHTVDSVRALYELGHRDFGENRAQEFHRKASQLPGDIRWHFVGPLQTNKVKVVRPLVHLLHSMDRRKLAEAWTKGTLENPPALLQVNMGSEPQKAGVEPEDVVAAFEEMTAYGVDLRGLMAIPPITTSPEDSRPFFRGLRELRDELAERTQRPLELSMGMTNDYAVAVEEGSTMIRVGRAIFGPRPE